MENTVTGHSYLDIPQNWLFPQLNEDFSDYIFQQDRAPPRWHVDVRHYLNEILPRRCIGRSGPP